MLRLAEPIGPVFRFVAIGLAWIQFEFTQGGSYFLALLVVINFGQLILWRAGRGVADSGFKGLVFDFVHTSAASLLVGLAAMPGEYLSMPGNSPLNIYSAPTLVLIAIYPRRAAGGSPWLLKNLDSLLLDVSIGLGLLGGIWGGAALSGVEPSRDLAITLLISSFWLTFAVILGNALATVGATFAASETNQVRTSFEGLRTWMEEELRPEIREIMQQLDRQQEPPAMIDQYLMTLDARIQGKGLSLITSSDEVGLASIISHGVKTFRPLLQFERIPPVSDQVISAQSAVIVSRSLHHLLDRVARAGVGTVSIDVLQTPGELVLIEHHRVVSVPDNEDDSAHDQLRTEFAAIGVRVEHLTAGGREGCRVSIPDDL